MTSSRRGRDSTLPGTGADEDALHRRRDVEHQRLAVAVEQSAESVVITDPEARIVYVNPAFERVTGYGRDEVLGKNPRILQSGRMLPAAYVAMWASLTSGRTWHGELINRRKDGSPLIEEATISPVLGEDGTILHFVAVKRDVTAARALQDQLDRQAQSQASFSAMVADLAAGPTPEDTAQAICDRVLTLPGVAFAAIALFEANDTLRPLAAVGLDRGPIPIVPPGGTWTPAMRRRGRHLREVARAGPAVEPWSPAWESPMRATFTRLGIDALAIAPIRLAAETVGFIQVGAAGTEAVPTLEDGLPILAEFGLMASLLLGPQLGERALTEGRRDPIRRLIARKAFRPVFQPIVDLASGTVVGFEALTRFTGGSPPNVQFAAAAHAGLGLELELATLETAMRASMSLPPDAWLDINVSVDVLNHPSQLAYLLWRAGTRPVVLEVTEHQQIVDYEALRQKLAELGLPVRLAIDDAGAGFASMRHILELRPDLIKLDRSLIVDLDSDPVRQGLVAGLAHFAAAAGASLVAEGIETEAELAAVVALGVNLGQGYLLGRPAPAGLVRRTAGRSAAIRASRPRPHGASHDDARLVDRVNAILWGADGTEERMTFVSEGAVSLTGHPARRWLLEPRFWENHLHPDDRAGVEARIASAIEECRAVTLEYRFRMADGTYRWFQDLIEIMPTDGGHVRLVGVMIDVTDRRRLEDRLAFGATHDPLTGLLNRLGFEQALADAPLPTEPAESAVIFLDLDDFKVVNDSLGHRAGDELLQVVAARILGAVRGSDVAARFGGDEFLVHASAHDADALLELARRVIRTVSAPSSVAGRSMQHPVSAGIAFMSPTDTTESAIRNADLAMYAAKRAGGNRLVVYAPSMLDAAVDRLDAAAVGASASTPQ